MTDMLMLKNLKILTSPQLYSALLQTAVNFLLVFLLCPFQDSPYLHSSLLLTALI